MSGKVKEFGESLQNNQTVQNLEKTLASNQATYAEAYKYAEQIGRMASENLLGTYGGQSVEALAGYVTQGLLKDDIWAVLVADHEKVAGYAQSVQESLNKAAGLGLKATGAGLDTDRLTNLINKIIEEIANGNAPTKLLKEPVINYSQNVVDRVQRSNVEMHYKAGLNPKIKRISLGNCCKWCSNLVGTYDYPDDVPKDVYRRHAFCRCQVLYVPTKGKSKDIHEGTDSRTFADKKQRRARDDRLTQASKKDTQYMSLRELRQVEADLARNKGQEPIQGGKREDVIASISGYSKVWGNKFK